MKYTEKDFLIDQLKEAYRLTYGDEIDIDKYKDLTVKELRAEIKSLLETA